MKDPAPLDVEVTEIPMSDHDVPAVATHTERRSISRLAPY